MIRMLAVLLVCAASATAAQEPPPPAVSLAEAVRRALRHYPSLLAARAEAEGRRAAARQVISERWPQVVSRGSLIRFQEPMVVAPFHAFDPTRPPEFDRTLLQGAVDLSYTLFDGGSRGARIAAVRAEARAAGAGTEAATLALLADVVDGYLAVLTSDEQLQAQEDGVRALSAERRRASQLLDEGRAPQVELLRVDAALAQARAAASTARNRLLVARRQLGRFLGAEEPDARFSLQSVVLADARVPARAEALADAEAANPRLKQARERVAGAAAARRAARASWFPHIAVTGGYLGFGAGNGDFSAEWQGGIRFSYPLFTGGARAGAGTEARARETAARESLRLVTLDLQGAVDRTLASIEDADATTAALAAAVQHFREVVRIEQLRLETGAGTETDFLREEANLRRVRAQLAAARYGAIAARVELARIAGLLSLDWLDRTVEQTP